MRTRCDLIKHFVLNMKKYHLPFVILFYSASHTLSDMETDNFLSLLFLFVASPSWLYFYYKPTYPAICKRAYPHYFSAMHTLNYLVLFYAIF